MFILFIDCFENVIEIDSRLNDTDHVPEHIRQNNAQILRQIGISDNLKNAENHLTQYSANWKYNVRIFHFDALYDRGYWDVLILAIDPNKATAQFTAIFVDVTGEHKIFLSNACDERSAMNHLGQQIAKEGFGWCTDDVAERYSKKWANDNLLKYDKKELSFNGLWKYEWNQNYHRDDFAKLKCFLVNNKIML